MEKGRILAFIVGLLAGLVSALLLLNDTEMYDDEGGFDDAVLGETEVRLSLSERAPLPLAYLAGWPDYASTRLALSHR